MNVDLIQTKVGYGIISSGESSLTIPIYIPFHVDDIILKTVSYTDTAVSIGTDMILIRTDLLGHEPLCAIPEASSMLEQLNNVFQINKPVSGEYSFTLYDFAGDLYTSTGDIALSMTISFVKHKRN